MYLKQMKVLRLLIFIAAVMLISTYWKEVILLSQDTIKYVQKVKLRYVFLAFILYIFSVFLFAIRWGSVLTALGYRIRARALVPILFGAISINNFTPANRMGGEPLRIFWLKEQFDVRFSHAFISIAYERAVEAVPVVALFLYVLSQLSLFQGGILKIVVYVTVVLFFAFCSYLIIKVKLSAVVKTLMDYSKQLNQAFLPTLTLSSLVWVQDILRLKLVTLAFGLHLRVNIIVLLSILYLLLGSVPLTPGGLGVVDGGLVSALTLFNIPVGIAIGVVAVERFISYVMSGAIGVACLLYFGGLRIWRSTGSQW
jgi:hypothetical protein